MQWIKTLIMFLALFLGSDALCAKSQAPVFAKNTPTKHFSAAVTNHSSLQQLTSTQSESFLTDTPEPVYQLHEYSQKKKTKYRCGYKRRKNIHLRYRESQGLNQSVLILKNLYCSEPEQYSTLLPEVVLRSRHKALSVIAPRA